ncbi:hypothetical protein BSL78_10408 [Apostichopus japonicus]|uniref:Uncharacterized protein n=1 Tax=Stichopus japonicus TaxID=307972 RepID=A0A2G8KXJ3_STIJA|nr:hypothetical protein BSL78_10408 [Apostichopus japonicus]
MERTKMPTPTSIQSLKENAPVIPPLTKVFYQTLLDGLAPDPSETTQRKTNSMESDAVFGASRGAVKPWKHTTLGLGVSSLLKSKTAITILNRLGYAVSYDECKRLETEIAYTCSSGKLETPAGLMLQPALATCTAWDNYDMNIETLDGKNSLHGTVGIAYQNMIHQQTGDGDDADQEQAREPGSSITGGPKRTYDGVQKPIPPFHTNLKTNDVNRYIKVLPSLIYLFFALNRTNYARWGSYYLERLRHLDPATLDILRAGAFSTRRTKKAFSRSHIDISLEQTVIRDAASSATGITHFANSESAFRRWCVSLTQRSMAVSEMKDMSGIQHGDIPANQLCRRRVERDNTDVDNLLRKLDDTCNPFAEGSPDMLVNVAT